MKTSLKYAFAALSALLPAGLWAHEVTVLSPDKQLAVTVSDEAGRATYRIDFCGQPAVLPSALGLKTNFGDFTRQLTIKNHQTGNASDHYQLRQAKQRDIRYEAATLTVDFENSQQQRLQVEFFVKDNDVAFRYLIPRQQDDRPRCAVVEQEATAFLLPNGTTTFLCPQINPMTGWERTKPSYEEEYKPDAPMTARSQYGQGYTFPCLFRSGDRWLLISETGVSSRYCGAHLSDYEPAKGYTIAYPQSGENNGFASASAAIALPGATPWRTITVGQTLAPVAETTIPFDVVRPLYQPSEDYKAGRYTWSWLIWQDNSVCWDDQVQFIDLASQMGYEYCLVDGFWDTQIGRDRIADLSKYAQQKGVSLLLWYNSNGAWNDAPQTPRNCMDNSISRDHEMAWLKKIGVKGIKVDFFAGDKQETMRLYEDILYDANRYGLQVIFHGCTLPRGWERMYPNYVASEAVLASENVFFQEYHAQQEAFQLTMHPFCRNAVGSMDWGGIILNRFMSRDNRQRHQRQTTNAFELATGITNQTALQCVAIAPNNLSELTDAERRFLRSLPTTWDETRLLDGYPGRYVVLARRHGTQWFVAALNAQKQPLELNVRLPMFGPKSSLRQIVDAKCVTAEKPLKTDKNSVVRLHLQPNDGVVVF